MTTFWKRGGGWVIGQAILFLVVFGVFPLLGGPRFPVPPSFLPLLRIGFVFCVVSGLVLMGAGGLFLGRSLTPLPHPEDDSQLVTQGIFTYVRHPIYGGILLLGLANAVIDPTLLRVLGAVLLFLFFSRKAAIEEIWLCERFTPEVYNAYRQRTARFIPFLY